MRLTDSEWGEFIVADAEAIGPDTQDDVDEFAALVEVGVIDAEEFSELATARNWRPLGLKIPCAWLLVLRPLPSKRRSPLRELLDSRIEVVQ